MRKLIVSTALAHLPHLLALWVGLSLLGSFRALAEEPRYSDLDGYKLNEVTLTGSHNTYNKKIDQKNYSLFQNGWEYLYDAFEYVHVIELDFFNTGHEFNVTHGDNLDFASSKNNCPKGGISLADRNQDLDSCIDSLRAWHDRNPNHPLVIVKFEPKGSFDTAAPIDAVGDFDRLIAHSKDYDTRRLDANGHHIKEARIPPALIFKPIDLMCKNRPFCSEGYYATPEEAVQHNNWPTMAELRGKFMFTIVPGTADATGPRKYARQLRNRTLDALNGRSQCNTSECLDSGLAFPAVFALNDKDPRHEYLTGHACVPLDCAGDGGLGEPEVTLLTPWFVVIDMEAGRVLGNDVTVPQSSLNSFAANRFLLFVSQEHPESRADLNALINYAHANVVDTDEEKSEIPFANVRRQPQPEDLGVAPIFNRTGAGLFLKEQTSGQCLAALQFGSAMPILRFCPLGSRTNSGYLGMSSGQAPAYDANRALEFRLTSVSFSRDGELRVDGLCLTATASNLDRAPVDLQDCGLTVPLTTQQWSLEQGQLKSAVDPSFCLSRLAFLSAVTSSLGTKPCAAASESWQFGSRGPIDPPVGDQIVKIRNPADAHKEPPTSDTCLSTAGFLKFQTCGSSGTAQLWAFNDITGQIKQGAQCLELSYLSDYAHSGDDFFVINLPADAYFWEGVLGFPSFYPRRGTSVGHRVVLVACNDNNPQQRFGWSADEERLIGVDGHVLFSDFWGGLRHHISGVNKPSPSDPPLLEDPGDKFPLQSEMNERLAAEHIVLDVVGLPPTARCKSITVSTDPGQCSTSAASASINDGSSSSHGNPLTLSQSPPGPYPVGTTSVTLTVSDGPLSVSCSATVAVEDHQPPPITCPATPGVAECTGNHSAVVTFANATIGADNCGVAQSDGCSPPSGSSFSRGSTTVTCSAHDGATPSNTGNCSFPVTIVDTTPPTITKLAATPNTLWPPNHKMVAVTVNATATDVCGALPLCQTTAISSNEPQGNNAPDWQITGPLTASLRAEREGENSGRVYTLTVTCTDDSGNSATSTTTVTVPHNQ